MTFAALLPLFLSNAPGLIAMAANISANIKAGRGGQAPTQADWDELARLSSLSAEDIYARMGITPPPPAPPPPSA